MWPVRFIFGSSHTFSRNMSLKFILFDSLLGKSYAAVDKTFKSCQNQSQN